MVPEGAEVLFNPEGTAPGLLFKRGGKLLVLLPGVPREMKAIFVSSLMGRLAAASRGQKISQITLRTTGLAESAIAQKLAGFEKRLAGASLAYLPSHMGVDLRLTATRHHGVRGGGKLRHRAAAIRKLLGNAVYGRDDETMEQVVGDLVNMNKYTLATAESCTGGLVADRITDVPGASGYFLGSVIAYSNALKEGLRGGGPRILNLHGAVSRETAVEMACGARARLGSDLALSATGIAGPGGGTDRKPVGLVFLAVAGPKGVVVEEKRFLGQRRHIKESASQAALNLLRLYLLE
jgi:nicotinamide-nucleotide amidase